MYVCMNNKIPIPEELLVNLTLAKHQRGSVTHLNRSEHNVNCHNDHLVKQSESLQTISINKQILEKHKILHQIINNGILLWFIQPWRISKWPHKAACPTWLWWWLHRWWHIIPWGNTIGSIKFLQWQQHAFFWGVWVWYAFSKSWRKWVLFLFVELGNIGFFFLIFFSICFESFWCPNLKNNFLKIKKNIILMHFSIKKHFEKQPQSHSQTDPKFFFKMM